MIEQVLTRIGDMIIQPKYMWRRIEKEDTTLEKIFSEYLSVLALIPTFAGFLGSLFRGSRFVVSFFWAIFFYVFLLIGAYALMQIIKYLAVNFKVNVNEISVYKFVAYSMTPFWVIGLFLLVPFFHWLTILGLYGFYIYLEGLFTLFNIPKEEKINFAVIAVLALILVLVFVFALAGLLSGMKVPLLKI
jgi:hypothetical protein